MALKTVFLVLHILGVVCGVGGVLMLDFHVMRHLRGARVAMPDVELTQFVSTFVKAGLVLVWASGLVIISIAPDGPAAVLANPMMQAKLVVVVVLTVNALFVETLALPLIGRNVGQSLFHGVDPLRRSVVLVCGAVSTLSWLYPIALGLAREINQSVPAQVILTYYAVALACMAAIMQVAGRVLYRPRLDAVATDSAGSADDGRAERARRSPRAAGVLSGGGKPGDHRVGEAGVCVPRPASRSEGAARRAGNVAFSEGVAPGDVARDFAALGTEGERQQFRAGLFEALRDRLGCGEGIENLVAIVARDEALRGKFAAVAPDQAARDAFALTMERARRRSDDVRWSTVQNWHETLMNLNRGTAGAPGDEASRRTAVVG